MPAWSGRGIGQGEGALFETGPGRRFRRQAFAIPEQLNRAPRADIDGLRKPPGWDKFSKAEPKRACSGRDGFRRGKFQPAAVVEIGPCAVRLVAGGKAERRTRRLDL